MALYEALDILAMFLVTLVGVGLGMVQDVMSIRVLSLVFFTGGVSLTLLVPSTLYYFVALGKVAAFIVAFQLLVFFARLTFQKQFSMLAFTLGLFVMWLTIGKTNRKA